MNARTFVLGCLACLCAAFAATPGMAGAWTQERGHGLVILKTTYDRATTVFDEDGRTGEPRAFRKIEGQLYGEWGLRNALTLILAPTFQAIEDAGSGFDRKAKGLAFAEVGTRIRLWQGPRSVLSFQPLVILPGTMGSSANAALASGHTDVEFRMLGGHSFTVLGKPMFIDVEGAWRRRGGNAQSEWRVDSTLGLTVLPRWQVLVQSFSTFGGETYAYHKGQVSLVRQWSSCTSLEMGVWQTFAGRNIVREQAVFTSIWVRL